MDETGATTFGDWDGKNERGVPVASGSYTAELIYHASGAGGSKIVMDRGFVVIQSASVGNFDGAFAVPNPARSGADILVSYLPTLNYNAAGRMFSMNGDLVGQADDLAQSGWLRFKTDRLAAGVYLIKMEKLSGGSVATRRVIKVAVVR